MNGVSFVVSILGLFLAAVGVYFPRVALKIEMYGNKFADMRVLSFPDNYVKFWLKRWYIIVLCFGGAKLIADFLFVAIGVSWEGFIAYLVAFPLTYVFMKGLIFLLYLMFYFLKILCWILYFISYGFVCCSRFINKEAEVLTGSGVIIAVVGTALSGYSFFF
ncbi:hypothetical protein KDX31_05180 [Amphritea atlantica]|uniref:Uncharacterized protein n=1 Tax=Amphritea atlantica TaxID=355243 RepID=A0ABY5GX82_9GAMM|nr:hypothetical protein KDX31_05180 [Amphritea atlantica]